MNKLTTEQAQLAAVVMVNAINKRCSDYDAKMLFSWLNTTLKSENSTERAMGYIFNAALLGQLDGLSDELP
jgi:hypothetical protein